MSDSRAAHRYALALIGVAGETKRLSEVNSDFKFLEKIIFEVREFSVFLKSPVVSDQKKRAVLTDLLKGRVDDFTLQFVLYLTIKGREGLIPEIIRQFYMLRDERLGILNVGATSAVKLSPSQEERLVKTIGDVTNKKIRIKYDVDPSLKGGFTIRFGDTIWDASVKRQLELLEKRFNEGG